MEKTDRNIDDLPLELNQAREKVLELENLIHSASLKEAESEDELVDSTNYKHDMVAIIDKDKKIHQINAAMEKHIGSGIGNNSSLYCYECIHGISEPDINCSHSLFLEDGKEHTTEIYDKKSGKIFEVSVSPLFDGEGDTGLCVHTMHDISHHNKTKKDLKKNELRLDQLFQSIPLPTYIFKYVKGDFLLEEYNQEAHNITMGQILKYNKKPALALCPDLPYLEHDLQKCFIDKKPIRREVKYKRNTTGEEVSQINTYSFMPPDLVSLCSVDITKLKTSEESMRASEERIQTIFESTSDGIIIANLDGIVVSSNTMACELFQRNYEDLMGTHLIDIIPSIDNLKLKKGSVEAWVTGTLEKEGMGERSEDETFPIEISSVIYTEKAGPRASIFIRDISSRKMAERANTENQKMKIANKMAITVAHEFNNPLSIVKGYVDIINMTKEMPEKNKSDLVDKIHSQISRMYELVEKMLNLRELKDIPYIKGLDYLDIHGDDSKEDEG